MKKQIAKFYLRYGRGESLLNIAVEWVKITVYFGAFAFLVKQWFGIELNSKFVGIVVILYVSLCFVLGWLDERYGIWKMQNDYATKELTPYFKEISEKIDKLIKGA